MAGKEMAFDIEVTIGDRKMSCTVEASSPGQLVEHATERFGIRMDEINELTIKSSTIEIKITPSWIGDKDRT